MTDNEKATGPAPAATDEKAAAPEAASAAQKRSRTVGILACVAGMMAAVLALIGSMSNEWDMLYILLFAGGMLVAVLGLRRMRGAPKKK